MGTKENGLFDVKGEIPGPGDYEVIPRIIKKGKSMSSFGGAKRFKEEKEKSPGPSDYDKGSLEKKNICKRGTIPEANRYSKPEMKISPGRKKKII